MAVANDLDAGRLRQLAELRDSQRTVLSLYVDLDPDRFATPRARRAEIDALLDAAHREIEGEERTHDELMALRGALRSAREILRPDYAEWARGARSAALFLSLPLQLEELLRLDRPLASRQAIGDTALIAPLAEAPPSPSLVVALVDERIARFMRSTREGLRERLTVSDRVRGRTEVGGWSQARFQRHQDHEVAEHLAHVADVLKETLRFEPYDQLLLGCPEFLWGEVIGALHPEVRRLLREERLSLDVPDVAVADVERALGPVLAQERAEHEKRVLGELREHLGRDGDRRAAAGLPDVLSALYERRVAALLYDEHVEAPGVRCTSCGWMGVEGESCPVDGTPLERRAQILDDAVRAAVEEDAEVLPLHDLPDLGPLGGVAATLRF
jgi:peptide chain release factor subunit 1